MTAGDPGRGTNPPGAETDPPAGGKSRGAPDGDPRVDDLLGRDVGPDRPPPVVLLGFPSDRGVERNGGRPGAAEGPGEIRRRLGRLTPDATRREAMVRVLSRTADLGDVRVTGDVAADQERLARRLAPHLARGAEAIVLGGGHETAFGHFLAYVEAGLRPRILNVDAHPDVREPGEGGGHSGSPFRQALRHPSGACRGYRVVGLQRASVAREHLAFLEDSGAGWRWREDVDREALTDEIEGLDEPALVSLDLDAVDAAHAPGVSAPATGGLEPAPWLAAAEAAGRSAAVRSLDLVELNPGFDVDGRTARLAAHTVWRFLSGLATRRARG